MSADNLIRLILQMQNEIDQKIPQVETMSKSLKNRIEKLERNLIVEPLPFDVVSPFFCTWWDENRPTPQSRRVYPFHVSNSKLGISYEAAKQLTIEDIVTMIENGDILKVKLVGHYRVREFIETFYQHGIVANAWYQEQIAKYNENP